MSVSNKLKILWNYFFSLLAEIVLFVSIILTRQRFKKLKKIFKKFHGEKNNGIEILTMAKIVEIILISKKSILAINEEDNDSKK